MWFYVKGSKDNHFEDGRGFTLYLLESKFLYVLILFYLLIFIILTSSCVYTLYR